MRSALLACYVTLLAAPAMAGDLTAEMLYGRDPGKDAAYACFSKTFDAAWLKDHPDQNVTRMTVFVARRPAEDMIWQSGNVEMHFRDSKATYQITADCGLDGNTLGCGVDCDGGGYHMSVISKSEIGVKIDGYVRYYDTADQGSDAGTAGFKDGDKNLVLSRTDLKDCLPLTADEDIKASIAKGALTQ